MRDNSNLTNYNVEIYSYFLNELRTSHARTVWASMRRNGDWGNLDVYLMLGIGARESASKCAKNFSTEISPLFTDILEDRDLEPAHQFVEQLRENLESDWLQKFVISSQQIGAQIFRPALETNPVWVQCSDLYGQGLSFREEVYYNFTKWFQSPNQQHIYDLLKNRITESWQSEVLDQLNNLAE
jgi:hypothetical protein